MWTDRREGNVEEKGVKILVMGFVGVQKWSEE